MGSPGSLRDQLALIRKLWKPLLGDSMEQLLAIAGEILREEELAIWMQFNPPAAQARAAAERRRQSGQQQWPSIVSHSEVPVFGDPAHEYEKFSPDTAWMPNTVLIAKSTYVWLAQLSKQYGRHIGRLDEIPDEELATLAHRGLNSLWLIGVWERSRASKTIKQLCGNQDAVASAYSLFDYTIAEDLGGEAAYINLRDRAYRHGVRLASDMVPNHMGIDSPWVIEHPEWFISRQDSPYPAYSFNGPDLSHDGRVEIKIEDHYFEQSDAAVVFRRRDNCERRNALHLSRQRRHQLSVERHRAARLPESRSPRAGDSNHPARRAAVSRDPLRRGHDAGQAAFSSPLVSGARIERRHSFARGIWHEPGGVRQAHAA